MNYKKYYYYKTSPEAKNVWEDIPIGSMLL
jgi:hypothetical protein